MPYSSVQRPLMDFIITSPKGDVIEEGGFLEASSEFIYLYDYISLLCFFYECGAIIGRALKDKLSTLEILLQLEPTQKNNTIISWQDVAEKRLKSYEEKHKKRPDTFKDFIFTQEALRITGFKFKTESIKGRGIKLFSKRLFFEKMPLKESTGEHLLKREKIENEMREFVLEGVGFGSRFPELTKELNWKYWAFTDIDSNEWKKITHSFWDVENPLQVLSLKWQEKILLEMVHFYAENYYPELLEKVEIERSERIPSNEDLWRVYHYVPLREESREISGEKLFEISSYTNPSEYKRDCEEKGIGVSTSFCHAVSKIMDKYSLSFSNACNFLEEKGFLIWAGNLPIYNLAGDKLWTEKKQKLDELTTEEKISEYTSDSEIKCTFITLVIRNQPLEEKYPGGLHAFVEKHASLYNENITSIIAMLDTDIADNVAELIDNGLVNKHDFVVFDAFPLTPPEDYSEIDIGVSWLKGYWHDGYYLVQFAQ